LLLGRALKAEFTDAEPFLGTNGWAENPASHGTVVVQVAETGIGIEHRTRLVIGKTFEFPHPTLTHIKRAGFGVAGEVAAKTTNGSLSSSSNSRCAMRIRCLESGQSFAEPQCIQLIDREWPDATLRAAGPAS